MLDALTNAQRDTIEIEASFYTLLGPLAALYKVIWYRV